MLLGWDQARPPDAPASVTVDVTGENSITVQILEPFDGAIATKFKGSSKCRISQFWFFLKFLFFFFSSTVQWSTRADFGNIVGEREIVDWTSFHGTMGAQCHINGLTQGRRYFIRATCGNVKGCGPYKTSIPASVVPSSEYLNFLIFIFFSSLMHDYFRLARSKQSGGSIFGKTTFTR